MTRFTLIQKAATLTLSALLFVPVTASAAVEKLVFVSEPATAEVGVVTSVLTVQSQNANSESVAAGETTDLTLISSSPTGEFSSSATTWKAVTALTMSSNSANRNFYYRDTTAGAHTITVNATGRTSGIKAVASTQVYIGTEAAAAAPQPETEDEETEQQESVTSSSSSSGASTPKVTEGKFALSGGSARTAFIRTPIDFRAVSDATKELVAAGISYEWSFGDGSRAEGSTVSHAYDFPGEYTVILNAYSLGRNVSVRIPVSVRSPKLELKAFEDSHIEISNTDRADANLSQWQLSNGRHRFVFPKDTVIASGKAVMLPIRHTKLKLSDGGRLALHSPDGVEFQSKDFTPVVQKSPEQLPTLDSIAPNTLLAEVTPALSSLAAASGVVPSPPHVNATNNFVSSKNEQGVTAQQSTPLVAVSSIGKSHSTQSQRISETENVSKKSGVDASVSSKAVSSTQPAGAVSTAPVARSVGERLVLWLRNLISRN